jgi:hypothetical protein
VARISCRNRKGDRTLVIMVAPGMIPGFPPPVPGISYNFRCEAITELRAPDGAAKAQREEIFASGLTRPFGIAFWPPGSNPRLSSTNSRAALIIRIADRTHLCRRRRPQGLGHAATVRIRGINGWVSFVALSRMQDRRCVPIRLAIDLKNEP